jgi:hypothetical protein
MVSQGSGDGRTASSRASGVGHQRASQPSRHKLGMSTSLKQAEHRAQNLARQTTGGVAAVVSFAVDRDELAQLDCLIFARGSSNATDFWSFVQYCRTVVGDHNRARTGWYDVVAGPVTASWKKQTVIPDGDQVSFHTNAAARMLDSSQKARVV